MREIENILPQGGLNLDDDKRAMSNMDSDYRLNIQYETGSSGTIVPVKGNVQIGASGGLVGGLDAKGYCEDVENDRMFYFTSIRSSRLSAAPINGVTASLYYVEGTELTQIFRNKTYLIDSSAENVDCRVIDGKLIWTDGVNDKRKINIQRAINTKTYEDLGTKTFVGETLLVHQGDYVYIQGMGVYLRAGGGTTGITLANLPSQISLGYMQLVTNDVYWDIDSDVSQIAFIKKPPTEAVEVDEVIAEGADRNPIVERLMSFSYRYVYKDNEKSVFAKPSRLVFNPYGEGAEEANTVNAVDITLCRGNNDVRKLEVVMQNVLTGNWFKIGEVKNSEFLASDTYTFQFQGGMVAEPIDNAEVEKAFDAVPKRVGTLCSIENRIIDANITEGFTIDTIPTITAEAKESTGIEIFGDSTAYTQSTWSAAGTKRFAHREYTGTLTETDLVPFGVKVRLRLTRTFITTKTKEYSIVSDGTETMAAFAQRFADEINTIHLDSYWANTFTKSIFNLFAGVQIAGGVVTLVISCGLPRMVQLAGLDLADYAGFDGYIESTDPLFATLATSSEVFTLGAFVSEILYSLDVTSGTTIFKGNSTYTIGTVYYDDYLRKTPVVNKSIFTMPSGQHEKGAIPVEVTISGEAPSWAKYYSIARSKGSVTDGEIVHVIGGGSATEADLSGDSTPALIKEMYIGGVALSETATGKVFWEWTSVVTLKYIRIWDASSGGNLVAYTTGLNLPTPYVDEDGDRVRRIPLEGKDGYIIVRTTKENTNQARSVNRYIELGFSTKETTDDGQFIYAININTYINAIRKSLKPDQNVYTPQSGDKLRVLKDSNSDTGLFTIEKIKERKVKSVEESDEAYFTGYYIYTYPSDTDLNFDNGGIIEMFVEKDDDTILYEESNLYPIAFEGGLYQHKGGIDQVNGGTIIYTLEGDAYLRERDSVSSDGSVIQTNPVESLRASDSYDSKVWARGRANTFDSTAKQKNLTTALRHGGRLLNETFINDISKYDSADIIVLPPDYGRIIRLIEKPNYIKAICEKRSVTIEIGREIVTRPDGTDELVAISRVFGTQRPSMNRWGTKDFRSVVDTGTELFYFDSSSRQMLSDGQNGQFPISGKVSQGEYSQDFKMHSYFRDMTNCRAGWDEDNKMLYVTGLVAGTTTTVGFHRPTNRWLSYYTFKPSVYMALNNRIFTVSTDLYEHNLDTFNGSAVPKCFFCGVQESSKVKLIANQHPMNMKLFDSLTLRAQGLTAIPSDFIVLEIEPNDTYDRGMYSIITSGMLRLEEGEYRAEILKNMKTTSDVVSNNDLHNGENVRGYYIEMLLDFGSSDYKLMGASVMQTISK